MMLSILNWYNNFDSTEQHPPNTFLWYNIQQNLCKLVTWIHFNKMLYSCSVFPMRNRFWKFISLLPFPIHSGCLYYTKFCTIRWDNTNDNNRSESLDLLIYTPRMNTIWLENSWRFCYTKTSPFPALIYRTSLPEVSWSSL